MIAEGTMEAKVVYEDDDLVAFDDIMPQAPVHTLVIPRVHHSDLADDVDPALLGKMLAAVPKIAEMKGVGESGYRLIVNNGKHASQSVGHLHVHILGGSQMSHGMVRLASDDDE
jgi:histidine triad (HIT) family protein